MSDLLCSRKALYLLYKLSKTTPPVTSESKFIRVTRKSLPIIVLGLIRAILVEGTDYSFVWFFVESFLRQNTDDTGIFSSRLRFFPSSRFYFILFFALSNSSCWSCRCSEYDVS